MHTPFQLVTLNTEFALDGRIKKVVREIAYWILHWIQLVRIKSNAAFVNIALNKSRDFIDWLSKD